MRDKVLCRGWAGTRTAAGKKEFSPIAEQISEISLYCFASPMLNSVLVSFQGGVKMKMSMDEFLDFFDLTVAPRDQEVRRGFLDMNSRQELDIICTTESLFKGTIVDFCCSDLHSGGGNYARDYFTTNWA